MEWRLLNNSAEDKELFNSFIAKAEKGHVLQTWEWGELKHSSGWLPLRLVVVEGGVVIAAVSLLKRSLPARLGSFFYASRGPVLDMENKESWECLLAGIREVAKRHRAVFCKLDPDIKNDNELWRGRLLAAGARLIDKGEGFEGVQPRHVFRLDISSDEETIAANFHQKTRYNIRLAEKKGVTVDGEAGRGMLPEFYRVLEETAKRDRFLIRGYNYYEKFYDLLVPAGMAKMFIVYYEGRVVAGSLAFLLNDKAWYIYGASANEYRNVMPNYLMQWRMIQWAKQRGCTLYDFRGVPGDVGEEHPLYGLVKFKRGFGGEYTCFIGEYDIVYKKITYGLYNFLMPKYQKLVRGIIKFKRRLMGRGK